MMSPSSWDVISGPESGRTIISADLPSGGHDCARFKPISSMYRFLRIKPPAHHPDLRLSADAYIDAWAADIRQDGRPIVAALGHCVGGVYAAAIAERVSRWQEPPLVILLDPQLPSMELLSREFCRDINTITSLLSDDEIRNAGKIATEIAAASLDVTDAADVVVRMYREAVTAAFERAGLGEAKHSKLTWAFEWHISWLCAASRLTPRGAWERSIAILSSDYAEMAGKTFTACRSIGQTILSGVGHGDLLRSDSVAAVILDLLESK